MSRNNRDERLIRGDEVPFRGINNRDQRACRRTGSAGYFVRLGVTGAPCKKAPASAEAFSHNQFA
jgi:hypothetical protein